jgi:hypothetical protein
MRGLLFLCGRSQNILPKGIAFSFTHGYSSYMDANNATSDSPAT